MKKIKNALSVFLSVIILLGIIPLKASSALWYSDCLEYNGIEYFIQDDKAIIAGYEGTDTDKLIIPETIDGYEVWAIAEAAFSGCQLTEIYVPSTVEIILPLAFALCGKYDVEQILDCYMEYSYADYSDYSETEKQQIKTQFINELEAYADNNNLEIRELIVNFVCIDLEIGIPVYDCFESPKVVIDKNNPYLYCDEYGMIYYKNGLPPYYARAYKYAEAFENYGQICCQATGYMEKYSIPDGVRVIFDYAFLYSGLKELTIPKSVVCIADDMSIFNGGLSSIVCSIEDVYYCGTEEEWEQIIMTSDYSENAVSCFDNATIHFGVESPTEKIFKVNLIDGSDTETLYVREGKSIVLPKPNSEYCMGWISDDKKETYSCGTEFTPTQDITLTAIYKRWGAWGDGPQSYKVSYEADGGTVPVNYDYSSNGCVTLPFPVRVGYKCLGWLDEEHERVYECGFEYGVEKDITLYAVWKKEDNHNTSVSLEKEINVNYKDSVQIIPKIISDADINLTYYSSSDNSVAEVDMFGNVYALKRGTTEITCIVTDEYGNMAKDTCTVNAEFSLSQWFIWIFLLGFLWY